MTLYHVAPNHCACHPETCCCDDWAVYSTSEEKHSTHFKKETAELVADALNAKENPLRPLRELLGCDKTVAMKVIAARDALRNNDTEEAYHQLYAIACPTFDSPSPWENIEALAAKEPT